ncbi:SPOR domain-containing protein [Deefgea salmonis]|uniref:SPOR domain-containing protein n=1 Tax=Deefgea salmonis TaxID=2875502 RepID=A0ABS8BP00_9NEIS|nr:SPOR domain-containing protein [Deefgea salmonis]MCB5197450.1 SPOR domain-containing protein [Deefgea salmonis]
MSRDMKPIRSSSRSASSSANSQRKSGGSSLITGLLLGLFVGIAIAVAVALYLNRSGNPFKNGNATPADAVSSAPETAVAPPEVLLPGNGKEVALNPAPASTVASKPASANASGERFDFYKVLPELNEESAVASTPAPVKTASPKASPTVSPAATPKAEANKNAWLQVGAFKDEGDADNLKAKLALLGVESRILTSDIPDKGIWHRVRIGPFNSSADLDKVRGQLKANGIDSAMVKAN